MNPQPLRFWEPSPQLPIASPMALQATQAGLFDVISDYYGSNSTHLILLNDSDALTSASTIGQFLILEPDERTGYDRQSVSLTGFSWDSTELRVESEIVDAVFSANSSSTIAFDAIACLINGSSRANQPVTSIASNTLTSNAHGLSNGDAVCFSSTDTMPSGITAGTVYYAISSSTNTFQIAATVGGAAIALGASWSGDLLLRYANGILSIWEQRSDDGSGDRTYTINPSGSHTINFQIGIKVGS